METSYQYHKNKSSDPTKFLLFLSLHLVRNLCTKLAKKLWLENVLMFTEGFKRNPRNLTYHIKLLVKKVI